MTDALASVPAVDAGEVAGPCRSGCGPGYRYGDEGCRHTPAAVDAGDREPASEVRCQRCGGLNGEHHLVHVRHGNGGGHNEKCPASEVQP